MLDHKGFIFLKSIWLESSKKLDILFGHFKRSWFKRHSSRSWPKDESKINVKNRSIFSYHNISIVSIFEIKKILKKTKTWITFCELIHNSLVAMLLSQFFIILNKPFILVICLDIMNCRGIVNKFIQSSFFERNYFIGNNILFA